MPFACFCCKRRILQWRADGKRLLPFALCEVEEDLSTVRRNMGKHLSDGHPEDESRQFSEHNGFRVSSEMWQSAIQKSTEWKEIFVLLYPECKRIAAALHSESYNYDLYGILECIQHLESPVSNFEQSLAHNIETKLALGSLFSSDHAEKVGTGLSPDSEVWLDTSTENSVGIDSKRRQDHWPAAEETGCQDRIYLPPNPVSSQSYPRSSIGPPTCAPARRTNDLSSAWATRYSNEPRLGAYVRASNEVGGTRFRADSTDSIAWATDYNIKPTAELPDVQERVPRQRPDAAIFLCILSSLYRALRALLLDDFTRCGRLLEELVWASNELSMRRNPGYVVQKDVIPMFLSPAYVADLINEVMRRSNLEHNAFVQNLMSSFWEDDNGLGTTAWLLVLDSKWAKIQTNLLVFTDEVG
jgi:hypothetical protein